MPTHKILCDLDVGGEVQGLSLDINGNADVSGNLVVTGQISNAGNTLVEQGAPKLILKDSTDNDDHAIIFRRNTNDDDYKIATADFTSGGGGDGFYIGSIVGAEVGLVTNNTTALTLDTSQNATFAGDITCGDDLFMPSAGVINFNSGDMTITHASNKLTVAGGTLAFGNAIIDTSSIVQIKNGTEFQDTSENTTMEFSEDTITFSQSSTIIEGVCRIRKRKFEVSSTSHGNSGGGDVVFFGSGSLTAGKIYYYTSGGAWALADADAESTAKGMIGVAMGSSSGSGVMLRGMTTLDHDPGTVGDTLFLHTTAGQASSTAPSGNGDIVRVIGYCLGSTNGEIYFNPDGTFVEVTA